MQAKTTRRQKIKAFGFLSSAGREWMRKVHSGKLHELTIKELTKVHTPKHSMYGIFDLHFPIEIGLSKIGKYTSPIQCLHR